MMIGEKGKTILLVEDDSIIALAEQNSLEKCGYRVIIALTGEKAIEVFDSTSGIDLVLMDINLGKGMDGTETAERLLKKHNIPILFLSSHTEPDIVEKTEMITSYGYVVKNSGITVLNASIKMAFKLFEANRKISLSEEKQKTMISSISDVIAIIDADGTLKYKSPNVQNWFGWQSEEHVGSDFWLTAHPDDVERVRYDITILLKEENATKTMEFRYRCKDGSYKPIELTAANLSQNPLISGVLLNYHDISARKRAEEARKEISDRFEILASRIPGFIAYVNADTLQYDYVNSEFEKSFGIPRDKIIGSHIKDVISEANYEFALQYINAVKSGKTVSYINIFNLVSGKRWVQVNYSPIMDDNGNVISIAVLSYDITELKRMQEALQEREARYRSLFENAPVGIFYSTVDGKIISVNAKYSNILGYSSPEEAKATINKTSIAESVYEKSDVRVLMIDKARANPGIWIKTSQNFLIKDGRLITADLTLRALPDNPEQLEGFIEDNSKFLNMKAALQKSERLFSKFFEGHSAVQLIIDPDSGVIIDANKAATSFYGWPVEKLRRMNIQDINAMPPEAVRIEMDKARTLEQTHFEFPHRLSDGTILDVEVFSNKIEIKGRDYLYSIVHDVTERKKAEAELRNNEARLRRLVDILQHESLSIQDFLDYALEQSLQETGSKFGYIYYYNEDKKEFVLNTWSRDVMDSCRVAGPKTIYDLEKTGIWGEAVRQRKPIVVNDFTRSNPLKKGYPEGHVQLSRFMTIPVFRGKRIEGVVGLANKETDYDEKDILQITLLMEAVWKVTERMKAEQALRESESRLKSLNMELEERVKKGIQEIRDKDHILITQSRQAAMGEMIGNIAHQWRQPLNLVSLIIQNIDFKFRNGTLDQASMEQYQTQCLKSIQYMSQTIDDFRNFFRPETVKTKFSLRTCIQKTYSLVEQDLKNGNIVLKMNISQDIMVTGYSNEFGQVILNLIHNSKEAFSENRADNREINITVYAENDDCVILFSDNAGGIPEAIQDRVFDPYFTTKSTGTGIGLYMSRMLIENQMGGRLNVRNIPEGAEFTIRLKKFKTRNPG